MFCIFGSFFNFFSKHLKYFNVCRRVSCCVSVCEKKTFPGRSRKAAAVLKVFCRTVSDPQATIRGNNCLFVGKGEQNESLCPFRAVNCSVTERGGATRQHLLVCCSFFFPQLQDGDCGPVCLFSCHTLPPPTHRQQHRPPRSPQTQSQQRIDITSALRW